jgi:cell division protein FtsQ
MEQKKIVWKRVGIALLYVLLFSTVVTLMAFSNAHQGQLKCWQVSVNIQESDSGFAFLSPLEIQKICEETNGGLMGKVGSQIDLASIRSVLLSNPYIRRAQVYQTLDGRCNIDVELRKPVALIMDRAGSQFYMDYEGALLPMKKGALADVPIFLGEFRAPLLPEDIFHDEQSNSFHHSIFWMAKAIASHPLWNAQIDQVYWKGPVGWHIIPRMGNQEIWIGDSQNFEIKMKNLFVFYSKTLPKIDLDQYEVLDARFINQIVGIKRNYIAP